MAVAWVRTSGDPGRVERVLAYFTSQRFVENASTEIVAAGMKKIQDGFRAESDPYGNPWAPLRYRRGKILRKTGRLYRSAYGRSRPGGVQLGLTADYAGYQNDGTSGHRRLARAARQNARGRFVGAGARTAYLLRIRAHLNRGITARPMVPDDRGLPPAWGEAFDRSVDLLVSRKQREL